MKNKAIFYAISDLHGSAKLLLEALQKIENETKNLQKLDIFVFFVGDFGFVFYDDESERTKKVSILQRFNFNFIIILGNHENYKAIYSLKTSKRFNGKIYVDKDIDSLVYVENG